MHFTAVFVALLALTPVLSAPVPAPATDTVDSLVTSAKGDAASLIHKMAPIAQEILTLLGTMTSAHAADAPKAVVVPAPGPSAPAPKVDAKGPAPEHTADPKTPTTPDHTVDSKISATPEHKEAEPAPPAPQPETGSDPLKSEPANPTGAESKEAAPESPAPTDAPDAATIQRRDTSPPVAEPAPAPTSTTTPSVPAPTANVKTSDVLKLRQLLARASMYEQAVEQILLAKGLNIEDRPTAKTAGGVAWGIANGPIMAVLGMSGMVQKQPS